jgi:hypothetical protein
MTAQDTDKQASLLAAIRGGSDLETACHFATLSVSQVYRWLERGKIESERIAAGGKPTKAEESFVTFWDELKKARADAVIRNVSQVQKAAQDGTWKAAAWWLERTMPDVYGKPANTRHAATIDTATPSRELTQE